MSTSSGTPETGETVPSGWAIPDAQAPAGGRSRGWLRGLIIVAVGVPLVFIGLTFLGGQVLESQRGTVQFGTVGGHCPIIDDAVSSFTADQEIYFAAFLERDVSVGEVVAVRVLRDGSVVDSAELTFDESGDCFGGRLTGLPGLAPGAYRIEYAAGAEALASGDFELLAGR